MKGNSVGVNNRGIKTQGTSRTVHNSQLHSKRGSKADLTGKIDCQNPSRGVSSKK